MKTNSLLIAGLAFAGMWWFLNRNRNSGAANSSGNSGNTGLMVDVIGRNGSAAVYTPDGALVGFTNTEFLSPWTIGYGVKK